jgi:hypothetical protein
MESFFAQAAADIRAAHCDYAPPASSASSCSAGACIAPDAGAARASIFDSALSDGRNIPAAAGEAAHQPDDCCHGAARALANLRDAAQQLGAHSLAAAANAAAANVAEARGGGRLRANAAAIARVRRELRRAEAAWSAVDCVGTARAVSIAVRSVFPGGAFRPPPLALRFCTEDRPAAEAAEAAPTSQPRPQEWLAKLAAAGSGRSLAAAGIDVSLYRR